MRKLHKHAVAFAAMLITVVLCALAGLVACGNVDVDVPTPGGEAGDQ